MTYLKAAKLEYIADTARLRQHFSPLVRPVLDQIKNLHPCDRAPGRMAPLVEEFHFHATQRDLEVAEEISVSGPRWKVGSRVFDLRSEADDRAKGACGTVEEIA